MVLTEKTLLICLLFCLTVTAWSRQGKLRCLPITSPLCKDIGFDKMRTPNFLHHDSAKEVNTELSQWQPLVARRCHPRLTLFLCSMYTPVCLEHEIKPCKTLCTDVKRSCEPIMRMANYSWPQMLECNQFPENNLCIRAEQVSTTPAKPTSAGRGNTCLIDGKAKLTDLQKPYCKNDFVIRARVQEKKAGKSGSQLVIKVVITKTLKGKISPDKRGTLRIRVPVGSANDCKLLTPSLKRQYFIMGKQRGKKVFATSILRWRKKYKKVKNTKCGK